MANNITQEGLRTLTVPAPAANTNTGSFVVVGRQFGVAIASQPTSGANVAISQGCVATLRKLNGASTSQAAGTNVHWDATNANCTISSTSNLLIGTAMAAASNTDTTISVALNLQAP